MTEPSIYDTNASVLRSHGYYVHPIGPNSKEPMYFVPSTGKYELITGWAHPARPMETSPQPGAGIGLRCGPQPNGEWIIAIDWDNEDAAIASMDDEKLASPVSKQGRRGFTTFHRSAKEIPSQDFLIDKKVAAQVLSRGRQTVLPPSIHPDTGSPYTWADKYTLYNCSISALPLLADDYIERIEKILRPLGYEPEPERPQTNGHDHTYDDESPFKQLNDTALVNLPKWVMDLGLYACRRTAGRCNYEAVATWRPSTTGKPLEQRSRNLKLSGFKGIKDFGNGETFSPIDLVMRARPCSRPEAVGWLQERVLPKGPEVDFEALKQQGHKENKSDDSGSEKRTNQDTKSDNQQKKYRFKITPFWEMRLGIEQPYLVDELIPLRGITVVWGPPKCFKSFFVLGMSLHIAKAWEFCDRAVRQGTVVYCAFEGGHGYPKRIEALRQHYDLPTDDRVALPILSGSINLINDHKALLQEICTRLEEISGLNTVPALVVLDTLNKSLVGSENKDLDMAAYIRAAEAIRDRFDCAVIVVHHCGYDDTRMRGHSSLPGALDAELSVVRQGDVATITVENMRDGPEGAQIVMRSKTLEVGTDPGGRPITSLVLERFDGSVAGIHKSQQKREWPLGLRKFREALIEAILTHGSPFKIEGGPTVKAVDLEVVRSVFYKVYAVDSDDDGQDADTLRRSKKKAFARAVEKTQALGVMASRSVDGKQIVWLVSPLDESHAS